MGGREGGFTMCEGLLETRREHQSLLELEFQFIVSQFNVGAET